MWLIMTLQATHSDIRSAEKLNNHRPGWVSVAGTNKRAEQEKEEERKSDREIELLLQQLNVDVPCRRLVSIISCLCHRFAQM